MKKHCTKLFIFVLLVLFPVFLPAQQKYALVIGNGNYTNIAKLNNPVNDANDVAAVLQNLGFTVDKVLNGTLDQIESATVRLKNRLSVSKNSYGFFFYAGHGVQSDRENYLIPVDANITGENYLRQRAVSVQVLLDELNDAGNELNVVVLDACRDNPFSWRGRSGSRGLQVVSSQPADSIIVYATSAGSTAADGEGRNGLFTSHLLNNLKKPGLEVNEVFRQTGADVSRASNRTQMPAVYNQFFGTAYLGGSSAAVGTPQPAPVIQPAPGIRAQDEAASKAAFIVDVTYMTQGGTKLTDSVSIVASDPRAAEREAEAQFKKTNIRSTFIRASARVGPVYANESERTSPVPSVNVKVTYMTQGGTKRTDTITVQASDPRAAEREAEAHFRKTNTRSTLISVAAE